MKGQQLLVRTLLALRLGHLNAERQYPVARAAVSSTDRAGRAGANDPTV